MKTKKPKGKTQFNFPESKYPGAMTEVANEMGYDRPVGIPDRLIPRFIINLVELYGQRTVQGMLQRQLVYRRNYPRFRARVKFQKMFDYLSKKYKGGGWN